jgi:branched-chain amino acid aminotransferase
MLDGRLVTPTCTAALPGITRATVLDLADAMGLASEQRPLGLGELHAADEAFLTGTAAGIVPVGVIDGRRLPRAPGATTVAISRRYGEMLADPDCTTELPVAAT